MCFQGLDFGKKWLVNIINNVIYIPIDQTNDSSVITAMD